MSPNDDAAKLMRILEARIRDIVRQEMRAKTGVIPGGPYGSFTVDSQGRIMWAGDSSGKLLAQAHKTGAADSFPSYDLTIDYDTVDYDPQGLITTGGSWSCTIPAAGYYMVLASVDVGISGIGASEYWRLILHAGGGGYVAEMAQVNIQGFTESQLTIVGSVVAHLSGSIYINVERNDIAYTQDLRGTEQESRFSLIQLLLD